MANPFENITFEQANSVFSPLKTELALRQQNREFAKGNDWQGGKGWVGPHFDSEGKVNQILKKEVARDFTSKGTLKSIVRRKVRGVVGKVPGWNVSLRNAPADPTAKISDDDKALIDEAQKILNEFWKHSRVHPTLKAFTTDFETVGKANLRLYFIQNGEREIETPETIEDAVKQIYLFKEEPESACIVMHKRTLKRASFCRYENGGNIYIEICYINDDGETVFKKVFGEGTKTFTDEYFPFSLGKYNDGQQKPAIGDGDDETTLPLNGQLLVFEIKGEPLVSPAMCSQQKLENKGFTMMSHNIDTDGFRAKKILNGLPPGEFKEVTKTDGGKENVFVADESKETVGAGTISYTSGLPTVERKEDGSVKQGYTTPTVHESEPIDVKTFTETIEAAKNAQLEEADQLHVAISGDATASGESRIQAKDDYRGSLEDTKSLVDDEMSNVCEAVLAVVAYLMENDGRYDTLQVSFNCILNTGRNTVEERVTAREEANDGFRSDESAMEQMNINDPDAMKTKIEAERQEKIEKGIDPDKNKKKPPVKEPEEKEDEEE